MHREYRYSLKQFWPSVEQSKLEGAVQSQEMFVKMGKHRAYVFANRNDSAKREKQMLQVRECPLAGTGSLNR